VSATTPAPPQKRIQLTTEPVTIDGPAGPLEALVETPRDGAVVAVAVVCHPHPLHRGTMHNKVAHTLSRSLGRMLAAAVRFNFRGVGESAGEFANGDGETEDALAVAQWCRRQWPSVPAYFAGFSFGAMVALRAAASREADGLVTVAPAVHRFDFEFRHPRCDWLVIQGANDEIVAATDVREWCARIDPPPSFRLIDEADHFFHGKLNAISETVREFFGGRLDRAAS
jgi:alpha/beta superfamily hydrolase